MNDLAKLENKLDWGYNEITNTHSIVSFKTDTHLSEVSVLRSDSGQWCTEGYKIRLADGKRTKINKFFIKNLKTKQDAFEAIYKIL